MWVMLSRRNVARKVLWAGRMPFMALVRRKTWATMGRNSSARLTCWHDIHWIRHLVQWEVPGTYSEQKTQNSSAIPHVFGLNGDSWFIIWSKHWKTKPELQRRSHTMLPMMWYKHESWGKGPLKAKGIYFSKTFGRDDRCRFFLRFGVLNHSRTSHTTCSIL